MEVWKNVTVKHLGRRVVRHVGSLRMDIVAVDVGIKPAYLYDVGQPCGEKLINLLQDLKHQQLVRNNLNVIEMGMDCLVVNVEHLKKSVDLVNINDRLVDVSKSLDRPCFCSNRDAAVNLRDVMDKIMEELDSTRVKLSVLPSTVYCNVTSLFGLMLNYPLIYWYDDSDGKGDNCLSMERLVCVKFTVRYTPKSNLKPISRSETKVDFHCLYSFSYPFCLQSVCEPVKEQWFDRIKHRLQEQEIFSDVKIASEEITLEAVSL